MSRSQQGSQSHTVSSPAPTDPPAAPPTAEPLPDEKVQRVRRFFEARDHVRRGICLLNAGCYDDACREFEKAMRLNPRAQSLAQYLVQCHIGRGDYTSAAAALNTTVEGDRADITAAVRQAYLLHEGGDIAGAVRSLRRSITRNPDCAELHFQLGTMLAGMGDTEEAELRFTQAVTLDPRHNEALVSLGMCLAARGEYARAVRRLAKAQQLNPQDGRIGQLLSLGCKAAGADGGAMQFVGTMPGGKAEEIDPGVEQLASILENEPEFINAFLDTPDGEQAQELHAVLLTAAQRALSRRPGADGHRRVELEHRTGRLLDRLQRTSESMRAFERCVRARPDHVPSKIELAKLYARSGRAEEAMALLRGVIDRGVRYADVYLMLGRLYAETGRSAEARNAYETALQINPGYQQARDALSALGPAAPAEASCLGPPAAR